MGDPGTAKSFRQLTGAAPSTASPSDSTLIIIDAQNEYALGALQTVNVASTRAAISSLLSKYRSSSSSTPSTPAATNIVHIVHQTPPGAPVFTPGTHLAEEFDELTPHQGEKTIQKQFPGSFTGTDLKRYLDGVEGGKGSKVVLTGYMAHVCVSTTARQASELGLEVVLVEGAIGDRDIPGLGGEEVTKAVLAELGDAFGTVVTEEDIK